MNVNSDILQKALGDIYIETLSAGTSFKIKNIKTDSRNFKKNNFFWPIKGEKFDGHDFILDVLEKGCAGFVYSKSLTAEVKELVENLGVLALKVSDTLLALQTFAKFYRLQSSAKIIAVTGSNGKTTTKDILVNVLSEKFKTKGSFKSFNNHLGVPLTLLSIEEDTEFLVVEMGMNHSGEITDLMEIAVPDIAIIINAGNAHMGNFKDFIDLVSAKGEMILALKNTGVAFVNHALIGFEPFKSYKKSNVKLFGREDDLFLNYSNIRHVDRVVKGTIKSKSLSFEFIYPGLGLHNAENVAAAAAALLFLGCDDIDINKGLKSLKIPFMRLEQKLLSNDVLLINDSYNANPASFAKAIETLDSITCQGKKYLVVGDMYELGAFSRREHKKLGEILLKSSIDYIYSLGSNSKYVTDVFTNKDQAKHFKSMKHLIKSLEDGISKDDIIMLKGSRAMMLEKLEAILIKEFGISYV